MALSGSKQNQQFNNQSTTNWSQLPVQNTPELDKLRGEVFQVDPGLGYQYARERARLKSGFNSPTGAYYSPQVKEAMVRSGEERLGQEESQAFRQGTYDTNKLNYGRDLAMAELTKPTVVQTGGTSSGTGSVSQSQSPWGTILSAGAQAAPMSL
jgi:hypothetical protein